MSIAVLPPPITTTRRPTASFDLSPAWRSRSI
jgi:hypothetical protein